MLRCNHCRTRRASIQSLTAHVKAHPECRPCGCGGYHFPHHRGNGCCEANPWAPYHDAKRRGEKDLADIVMEIALDGRALKIGGDCPF